METKPTTPQVFALLDTFIYAVLKAERQQNEANVIAAHKCHMALTDAIQAACDTPQLVAQVRAGTIGLEEALDLLMPVVQEAVQQEFSNAADAMKFIEDGLSERRNGKM